MTLGQLAAAVPRRRSSDAGLASSGRRRSSHKSSDSQGTFSPEMLAALAPRRRSSDAGLASSGRDSQDPLMMTIDERTRLVPRRSSDAGSVSGSIASLGAKSKRRGSNRNLGERGISLDVQLAAFPALDQTYVWPQGADARSTGAPSVVSSHHSGKAPSRTSSSPRQSVASPRMPHRRPSMKRGNTEPMRLGENKDERLVEAWLSDLIGQVEREEELRLEAAAKIRAVVDSLVSITEFRGETSGGKFAIMPLSRYEALSVRVEPLQQQIQIVDDVSSTRT